MANPPRHHAAVVGTCLSGVQVVSLVSDRRFPRHSHDQFGVGVMRAGGHASWSGRGPVEAGPGDVIAVSPEEMHDGAPVGAARAWEMIFVEPAVVAGLVGAEAARREIGFAARTAPQLRAGVSTALRLLGEAEPAAAEEAATALLAAILAPAPDAGDVRPSPATLRAMALIRDRPEAPPALGEVAAEMGLARTAALRRFRREVGATPHEYGMQHRLGLARRALAGGAPPALVAVDLGFADQSHLTRAFGRQFGLTPGRVRAGGGNIVQDGDVG